MRIIDQLFNISGHVALVTGGSSGIGRAIAFCLAEAGASVVLAALEQEEDALKDAVKDVEKIGAKAAYLTCDVSDPDELATMAEQSASFFGAPDILVNAAGVNTRQHADEVTPEMRGRAKTINFATLYGQGDFSLARQLGIGRDDTGRPPVYRRRRRQ